MLRTIVFAAAAAMLAQPRPADACHNAVQWTVDDYVRVVVKAERHLESGQFGAAKKTLGKMRFPTAGLQERADDVRAVIALRMGEKKGLEAAAKRFATRSEKVGAKDVRFRAWLAEALLATGKKDEARPILVELKEKDLMPDAYAYLALAKLSSGTERFELWKQCRNRAKNKEICELPAEMKTVASSK